MNRPKPTQTIGQLADYLQATQDAIGPAEDVACVILYRSELAKVLAALRSWEALQERSRYCGPAWTHEGDILKPLPPFPPVGTNGRLLDPRDRGPEGTGPLTWTMTRLDAQELGLNPPADAAPKPAIEPEDQFGERITEEELLAGLERMCGPPPPAEVPVQPRAPKRYGAPPWRPSSVSAPVRPCSPGFGLSNGMPDTPSSGDAEEPEGI